MDMRASLERLSQDVRFGGRMLVRNPGFAVVAILTLALGIGANAAIFGVVNAVLLRPLPWSEADRAVMIWSRWTAFDKTWVAEGEVVDYRRRSRTLEQIAAWDESQVNLTGDGEPERVAAGQVSANLFSTLGVAPLVGRTFTPDEDVPNGPALAVLSYGLWTRRYASDPAVVGRSILVNGGATQIVGVMPRGFVLPTDFANAEPTQLWTPLQIDPARTDHGNHGLYAAGRLKPGATVAQAAGELHDIARAMTAEGLYPPQMAFDTVVLSLEDEAVGGVRRAILLLSGAVGFLLLIACANVANLLLARAEARQREIAVRSALGAGSRRLLAQLLTESLALTGISTAAGLALAFGGIRLLTWWDPANVPRVSTAGLDGRVLAFTAIVATLTTLAFSLVPALRALRVTLADSLKDGSQSASAGGGRQRFRNTLVVVEMALAVILLIGAGLMLRSLWSLQRVDLGLDPSNVLTMRLSLPQVSVRAAGTGRRILPAPARTRSRHTRRARGRRDPVPAAGLHNRGLRPGRRRLHTAARHECQGGLGNRHRRLPPGDGRAPRARPRHRGERHGQRAARHSDQRGNGRPLLGRPRSAGRPSQTARSGQSLGHRHRPRRQRQAQWDRRRGQGEVLTFRTRSGRCPRDAPCAA